MKEIFKDIKGYESLYQVSNLGRIKSMPKQDGFYYTKEKILKPIIVNGRKRVVLCKDKKHKNYFIYQLVAETFLEKENKNLIVNHKDGDPTNDNVNNLEWCTYKENTIHALKNNLIKHYKIKQYDKEGNYIKTFNRIGEIENIDKSSIIRCCNGIRKTAGGYIWKYDKEKSVV